MTTPKRRAYADQKKADALASALMELPDNWVICRDMRHAWDIYNDFHVAKNLQGVNEIRRELICMRCTSLRREIYYNTLYGLEKAKQYYQYPDRYQMQGVPRGNKPSAIINAEQYRRAMERLADRAAGE